MNDEQREIIDLLGQLAAIGSRRDMHNTRIQSDMDARLKLVKKIDKLMGERKSGPDTDHAALAREALDSLRELLETRPRDDARHDVTPEGMLDAKAEGRAKAMEALKRRGPSLEPAFLLTVNHVDNDILFMIGTNEPDEVRSILECLAASQPSASRFAPDDFEGVLRGDSDKCELTANGATVALEQLNA